MNCNQCNKEIFNHPSPLTKFCKDCGRIIMKLDDEGFTKTTASPLPQNIEQKSGYQQNISNTAGTYSKPPPDTTKPLLIAGIVIGLLALGTALYFGLRNNAHYTEGSVTETVTEEATTTQNTVTETAQEAQPASSTVYTNSSVNSSSSSSSTSSSHYFEDNYYTDKIKQYYQYENNRNFDELYNNYLFSATRYYDFNNPSYDQLKGRFEHLWGITSDVSNNLKSFTINRYDNHAQVNVLLDFSYFGLKTQEYTSKNDINVVFNFDNNGNIIGIYDTK